MRGSRFWRRGCRRGPDPPPPPAPLQNWSSLNFHCKVNPGQTKKNRRTLPLDLGLFYYVYLRYLDFQTVGGGGSPNLRTLCLGRSVHVDLLKMAVREGGYSANIGPAFQYASSPVL